MPKEIRDHFLWFLGQDPKGVKVGFIPTAADPEDDKWFVQASLDELDQLGMEVKVVDLKGENKDSLLSKLAECEVIYVNGGNTFYLLDWVRKSGFDQIIGQLLDGGKIYCGVSAGSILAGPDIDPAGWKPSGDVNQVGIENLTALSLVPFAIFPHYTENHRRILEEKTKGINYPVIALTDKQAIMSENGRNELVGEGQIRIFNGNQDLLLLYHNG